MAQDPAESIRVAISYGSFINQFQPDTIKSIRQLERAYVDKIYLYCSMKYALMTKCCPNTQICICMHVLYNSAFVSNGKTARVYF